MCSCFMIRVFVCLFLRSFVRSFICLFVCLYICMRLSQLRPNKLYMSFKATDGVLCWSDLPCLVTLLTWLHVSDYHNFWNSES